MIKSFAEALCVSVLEQIINQSGFDEMKGFSVKIAIFVVRDTVRLLKIAFSAVPRDGNRRHDSVLGQLRVHKVLNI